MPQTWLTTAAQLACSFKENMNKCLWNAMSQSYTCHYIFIEISVSVKSHNSAKKFAQKYTKWMTNITSLACNKRFGSYFNYKAVLLYWSLQRGRSPTFRYRICSELNMVIYTGIQTFLKREKGYFFLKQTLTLPQNPVGFWKSYRKMYIWGARFSNIILECETCQVWSAFSLKSSKSITAE